MSIDEPTKETLWEFIDEHFINDETMLDLSAFKSNTVNFSIAIWNPATSGLRYLKTLLYTLASQLTDAEWARVAKTRNRDFGKPFTVRCNGVDLCIDYYQATLELGFIERQLDLSGADILEIGAGYGRTPHTVLENHEICSYTIVDLASCLRLSQAYLERVLPPELFVKLRFVPADDLASLSSKQYDLAINIDSFAEMDGPIVMNYLKFIDEHSRNFYVKNPVGKYADPALVDAAKGNAVVQLALRSGLLRDVIDVYDQAQINGQAGKFLQAYNPGNKWSCSDSSWARPWSYYREAFYRRAIDVAP